ncbi:MAG: glycosyl hydrolase [Bradymonadia bacterium]
MGELHIKGKDLLAGFKASAELSFTELSTDELLRRLRKALDIGLHGVSFSAYEGQQTPEALSQLSEAQVQGRLERIAPYTKWIRTFSCLDGNEHGARLAHQHGLKTLVGAWIGEDEARNRKEIEAVIEVARAGHADLIAVGNEVILRGEMEEARLIEMIEEVRAAVPGVPVGYVDAYFVFVAHPAIAAACDFIPVNCYPFWEEVPLERSVNYAQEMVRRVQAAVGDKPVVIAETGWPTAGEANGPAEPSLRNMALYLLNILAWTDDEELPLFWFSAYDEAWKVGPEGDCGAFWGLWDADGGLKLER